MRSEPGRIQSTSWREAPVQACFSVPQTPGVSVAFGLLCRASCLSRPSEHHLCVQAEAVHSPCHVPVETAFGHIDAQVRVHIPHPGAKIAGDMYSVDAAATIALP